MYSRRRIIGAGVVSLALFGILTAESCGGNPSPDSDSSYGYASGSKIDVDQHTYLITGEVTGQVNNLTRQVKPAEGSLSGTQYSSGYGTLTGSFTGPIEAGKGFVRLLVTSSNMDIAPVGELTILKTVDTKVTALLPGDVVTFKCRKQYENIAAVKEDQKFNKDEVATWEADFCRLTTGVVQAK